MSIDKRPQGPQPGAIRRRLRSQGPTGPAPANSAGKEPNEQRGFDPYNSGTFDRKNNWIRVGKR